MLFFISFLTAQESKTVLKADAFIGIDNLENTFYIKNNTLYKKGDRGSFSYTNYNLGAIKQVDISNSLKVLVYFQDFNYLVWLDSNLNQINEPIDLNTIFNNPLKYVANAFNNNVWIFNEITSAVSLLNTNTLEIEKTILIEHSLKVNFIKSTYKAMYLFTDKNILEVNFMGSIKETVVDNAINYAICNKKNILYSKEGKLFIFDLKKKTKIFWKEIPKKANTFFVLEQSIYIFEKNYLYKYSLPNLN